MKPLGAAFDVVPVIAPLDLQTARTGDYVDVSGAQGVAFVIFKGVGTAADDPTVTIRQAKTAAGGSVKDLSVVRTIYKKQGTLLTAVGTWSKVTQSAAATFIGDGTSAEEQGVYLIQVEADELDVDNGFKYVVANIGDVGTNAQIGCVLALLYGLRDQAAPEALLSVID